MMFIDMFNYYDFDFFDFFFLYIGVMVGLFCFIEILKQVISWMNMD